MTLTLRQMTYFVALADARHFGTAAARMNVSQPALSMQVRDLEAELGGPLVERLPRDVRLTTRGKAALERIRAILAQTQELESEARRGSLTSHLKLGLIPTVAPYLLPPLLSRARQAGGVDLRLREAQTKTLTEELRRGDLDAIVTATAPRDTSLVAEPLFNDNFVLAGRPERLDVIALRMEALRPDALDPTQLILLEEGHCLADHALAVCGLERDRLRLNLGASSLATLCGLVAADYGLTFLPEIAIATERRAAPNLAVTRFARPEPGRTIYLTRRATTAPETWFPDLAGRLRREGLSLVEAARSALPAE